MKRRNKCSKVRGNRLLDKGWTASAMLQGHTYSQVFANEHWLVGSFVDTANKAPLQYEAHTGVFSCELYSIYSKPRGLSEGLQCPCMSRFNKGRTSNSLCHGSKNITHGLGIKGCTWNVVEAFRQHAFHISVMLWDPVKACGAKVLTTRHATGA